MSGRGRRIWMVGGAFALVLVVALGVALLVFRDRATPVEYQELPGDLITGGDRAGDFGVYRYATTGFETTDALTGSRHDYPERTFLTIQPGGCGTLVRWQPLQERWYERDYCPDEGLAGWQTYHQWFGVGNLDVWGCAPPLPTRGEPGATWSGTCTRAAGDNVAAAEITVRYEVLGYEALAVGAEDVETLHLRVTSVGTGGSDSRDTTDTWILPGTQLVVRQVAEGSSTTQSRIGPVQYHEEYEINLESLNPWLPPGPTDAS